MEKHSDIDELLVSYLLGELSAEEETFVIAQINSDQTSLERFKALENTWKLLSIRQGLEQVDINNEWTRFERKIAADKQLLFQVKNNAAAEIPSLETEKASGAFNYRRLLSTIAVAASVLALVTVGWYYLDGPHKNDNQVNSKIPSKPEVIAVQYKRQVNTSGRAKTLLLQDGSEITLADKSEISYPEPFSGNKRDIMLKGSASFKVAKDKSRPFTVYSLDLATTALGTHFTVAAFEQAKNITVKLYEGKVVVKRTAPSKTPGNDYYLQPGDQLIYNKHGYTARIVQFRGKAPAQDNIVKETLKDDPMLPGNNKGNWYMFNNESLEQVLDELKMLYSTDIEYSKKDIHNLYFVGKFEKTDSLSSILYQVTRLNNLKVSKKGKGFVIAR